jgi:flagellar motor switch protein FliG
MPEVTNVNLLSKQQKVAALLIAVGPEKASQIMKSIPDEAEVEAIAMEIASMNKVSPEVVNTIMEEFYSLFQATGHISTGGVNYAKQLLKNAYGDNEADSILERLVSTLQTNPFQFFNNADPQQLATSFQNENPQLVSLILAYLKPDVAAGILGNLSPEVQLDVATRIAKMDRTNPEVLREVERILESKFSSLMAADYTLAGGVEALAEILNRSDRTTEKSILDHFEVTDPEMSEDVRNLMFVFEDIIYLDDRSVQRVLREVETKDLALSLKGVDDAVSEKILKNMSDRAAEMLQDDMDFMGPVRSRDVQEKQSYIVGIIRALESGGEITVSRGGDDDELIE